MVGRGDGDGVDVGARQDLGVVTGDGWRWRDELLCAIEVPLVAVGGGGHLDAGNAGGRLHEQRAPDADTDEAEPHRFEGEGGRVVDLSAGLPGAPGGAGRGGKQRGFLEELPPVDRAGS